MRLLYTEQCGPGPFRQLFDDVRPLYTVHRDTVGKDDVIMFGGGTDIDPKLYGELPNRYTQHADVERDKLEKAVFDLLKDKVRGFLGICRGSQYLTVLSGGKLIQDVGLMHGKYHNIVDTRTGETYYASSTHHQMMRPWVLPAGDYEIIAQAATKLSFSYHGEPG